MRHLFFWCEGLVCSVDLESWEVFVAHKVFLFCLLCEPDSRKIQTVQTARRPIKNTRWCSPHKHSRVLFGWISGDVTKAHLCLEWVWTVPGHHNVNQSQPRHALCDMTVPPQTFTMCLCTWPKQSTPHRAEHEDHLQQTAPGHLNNLHANTHREMINRAETC